MAENLKTTHFTDYSPITYPGTDNESWRLNTSGAYAWFNNDEATYKNIYGALYNWHAVGTGKLCPAGWHVPSDGEWTTLENYLIENGYNYDGTTIGNKISKALGATTWYYSPNTGAVGNTDYPNKRNASGFTALPCGFSNEKGFISSDGYYGAWWSTTEYLTEVSHDQFFLRYMMYDEYAFWSTATVWGYGLSVRCLKD
jgi:uncharacterized protein (TIGR02145 family)